MKVTVATMGMMATMVFSGCATLERFGIGESAVEDGVQLFLERNELDGLVTREQTQRFLAVVKADQEMLDLQGEIQAQIETEQALQNRINELGQRYILDGRFIDPATNAVPEAEYVPQPGDDDRNLWKPISESDGRLVILLRASLSADSVTVAGNGREDQGRYGGIHNGNRQHWRFPVAGAEYGDATVTATLTSGEVRTWEIPRTGEKQNF